MENTKLKAKTTNNSQFVKLVENMEKNPNIARGFPNVGKTKETVNEFWKELTVILNCLGPPIKECVEWRKVWNDYKRHLENKIAKNKEEIRSTGGGTNAQFTLSPLEQQVDAIINLSASGAPTGRSFGGNDESEAMDVVMPMESTSNLCVRNLEIEYLDEYTNDENNQNNTNITKIQSRTARTKSKANPGAPEIEKQRVQLLEKQTSNQTEILDTLKRIEKNHYNQQHYYKKMLELKVKKLEVLKGHFKKQEEAELNKQKLILEKLKLKKRLLVIQERKLGIQQSGSSSDSD